MCVWIFLGIEHVGTEDRLTDSRKLLEVGGIVPLAAETERYLLHVLLWLFA